jgi:hypothetical protein
MKSVGAQGSLDPSWYNVAQAAQLLEYGETKGLMLITSGDLRSLKDERARRVLPEWVEVSVRLRASRAEDTWGDGDSTSERWRIDLSLSRWVTTLCVSYHEQRPSAAQVRHRLPPSGKANTVHPIGRTTGADSMNQTQSQPSEPLRVRDGDAARNLRFWTRPPRSAGADRRPVQLHSPRCDPGHAAISSGRRERLETLTPSRFPAVASSRLCPDGRTFIHGRT